jgi:signal transduction histidine kinase
MKISHRLYLTALPAIVGVLVVAALAYWGQYAHAVPQLLLVVAVVATIGSVVLSWTNARYVVQRIERLAGVGSGIDAAKSRKGPTTALMPGRVATHPDELDAIEGVVDHLSSAVAEAELTRAERESAAERQLRDYANMLGTIATESAKRLEEVRLPLHILLENHFGDLNENQEEMLGAARTAAEAVDADVIALQQIAELDLGKRELRRDRLLPADLVRSLVPTLQAIAEQQNATLTVDLEPLIPAIRGDQPQLQDALAAVIGGAIRAAATATEMHLRVARDDDAVRIELRGGGAGEPERDVRLLLASRILSASGGSVSRAADALTIRFPSLAVPAPK